MKTAEEVSEELLGTCTALTDVVQDGEENDPAFCKELDELIFCCDSCGWWSETGEQDDNGNCESCAESQAGEDA